MAVGDQIKEALMVTEKVLVKLNEDIEKGEVIYNDGNGFLAAPNTVVNAKLYVAREAHDYSAATTAGQDHYIRASPMGCIAVQKIAGVAVKEGQLAMVGSTDGEVTLFTQPGAPTGGPTQYYTSGIESSLQTALDKDRIILGTFADDAASAATEANVWVGVK